MTLKISEADVKLAVAEWLQYMENQLSLRARGYMLQHF